MLDSLPRHLNTMGCYGRSSQGCCHRGENKLLWPNTSTFAKVLLLSIYSFSLFSSVDRFWGLWLLPSLLGTVSASQVRRLGVVEINTPGKSLAITGLPQLPSCCCSRGHVLICQCAHVQVLPQRGSEPELSMPNTHAKPAHWVQVVM